jgi:hypothetical protein
LEQSAAPANEREEQATIDRQFSIDKARKKLHRHYQQLTGVSTVPRDLSSMYQGKEDTYEEANILLLSEALQD